MRRLEAPREERPSGAKKRRGCRAGALALLGLACLAGLHAMPCLVLARAMPCLVAWATQQPVPGSTRNYKKNSERKIACNLQVLYVLRLFVHSPKLLSPVSLFPFLDFRTKT